MVLWAKSGPAPVNLALHTVVWMGPDSALVFGGLDSCNEGSVATNKLWQWSRNVSDGGWKELSPLPYLCGLYFHTANTIVSLSQSGMVVYGGLDCNNTVSTDHFYLFDFQTLKWTQPLVQKIGVKRCHNFSSMSDPEFKWPLKITPLGAILHDHPVCCCVAKEVFRLYTADVWSCYCLDTVQSHTTVRARGLPVGLGQFGVELGI